MKNLREILCIAVTLLVAMPAVAGPVSATSKKIAELEDAYLQSIKTADTDFLEKNVDDDYRGTSLKGLTHDKAGLISHRKAGAQKFSTVDLLDRQIRILGNTAIVWEKVRLVSAADGKPLEQIAQVTRVWHSNKNGWKVVAFQATEVSPSP